MPRIEFSTQFSIEERGILTATFESNNEVLGIDQKNFIVRVGKKRFPDKLMYGYLTPINDDANDFKVFFNTSNDLHRNIRTLSHEMIHAKQQLTKKLQLGFNGLYWKGNFVPEYIATSRLFYSILPWEQEAHHLDKKLYSIAVKKLNLKETEENDD